MIAVANVGMGKLGQSQPSYPWWCDWWPSALSTQTMAAECGVIPQAEIEAQAKASIQKAAGYGTPSYNPQLAAQEYQAFLEDEVAYCADPANASNCAAFKQAQPGATCQALFGTGSTGQSICNSPGLWAAGAVLLVIGVAIAISSK